MKKQKKYSILFLLIFAFILVGCDRTEDAFLDKITVNNSTLSKVDGRYEIISNFDKVKVYLDITENVGSYRLTQTEYDKEGNVTRESQPGDYVCYSPSGKNPYEQLKNLQSGHLYMLSFRFYKTKDCSVSNDGDDLGRLTQEIYTYRQNSSNETYISVENITEKLGSWSYYNKSNGVEVSCASYGIEDKEENIPLCIALARVGASASDCADFIKNVYQKGTGNRPDAIYTKGTLIAEYTSRQAIIPSGLGLKDGDLITLYNGNCYDCWSHIGMVFYWDAKNEWYTVSGNMSGKVKLYSVQGLLDNSNRWTRYLYRSQ